jgi:hypothetical protein
MKNGGRREGAGRKPGSKSKATIARETHVAAVVKAAIEQGDLPLDVILRRMRGEVIPDPQYFAAVAAAPYLHPKLTAVAPATMDDFATLSDEQLADEVARERAALAAAAPGTASEGDTG